MSYSTPLSIYPQKMIQSFIQEGLIKEQISRPIFPPLMLEKIVRNNINSGISKYIWAEQK
jgi:hypothetical protein